LEAIIISCPAFKNNLRKFHFVHRITVCISASTILNQDLVLK
jgi:hypothetical protein